MTIRKVGEYALGAAVVVGFYALLYAIPPNVYWLPDWLLVALGALIALWTVGLVLLAMVTCCAEAVKAWRAGETGDALKWTAGALAFPVIRVITWLWW